jgi:hypothetical protein
MPATDTIDAPERAAHCVPAELSALLPFRAALTRALEHRGWQPDQIARVLICALEGMANAVEHGSCHRGLVALAFTVTSTRAEVRGLSDHAEITRRGSGTELRLGFDRNASDRGELQWAA